MAAVEEAWGSIDITRSSHASDSTFPFRAARFGNVTVALAPDRGRSEDRRADYHDPRLPPRHALVAFGLWLQKSLGCHALVHVGAHGTLEWLPGKTVALSENCFPEIVTGGLPVVYPFIVSNPGEAAQAKRRIAAVTIGHLPPPLTGAGLDERQQALERLVDEYAQADGLDRRRRDRLAQADRRDGASDRAGRRSGRQRRRRPRHGAAPDRCLALRPQGFRDQGRPAHLRPRRADEADPLRTRSAEAERDALLAALDGRHITAGPSGAPARGRTDVLPTGRNLFTADPRTMPTPTAFELGRAAADEVMRRYAQDHGDWPRALVIDLWGSASLRTGGEEIAQGLALMGCRPQWDAATGRVTGVEVLPPAALGRPRVDVTFRISGLFRDMFPAQIALIDAAVGAVAARDEADGDNPLAEALRTSGKPPRARVRLVARNLRRGHRGPALLRRMGGARRNRPRLHRRHLARLRRRRRRWRRARPAPSRSGWERRASDPYRRRSRPRHARRLGRRRLHRRLRRSAGSARPQRRPDRARHDRPGKAAGALARARR